MNYLELIKSIVENFYSIQDISIKSRELKNDDARKVFSYIAEKHTGSSNSEIMDILKRDRSTFYNLHKKAGFLYEIDEKFRNDVRMCEREFLKKKKNIDESNNNKKDIKHYADMLEIMTMSIDVVEPELLVIL